MSNWPPTEEQFQRYLERERRASRRHHLIFWSTIAAMVVGLVVLANMTADAFLGLLVMGGAAAALLGLWVIAKGR